MARKPLTAAHTEAAVVVPPQRRVVSPAPRIFATLVLDTSGSMQSSGGLAAGVAALPGFRSSVLADERLALRLEWSVVTFADVVTVVREFGPIADWEPPVALTGGNGTAMGTAILDALRLQAAHVSRLAEHGIGLHHAFMILCTDGYPTGEEPELFDEAARRVQEAEKGRFSFYPIGVAGADFEKLSQLTLRRKPLQLASIGHFSRLMGWVLKSMTAVSNSYDGEAVALANPMVASDPGEGWAVLPAKPQNE